MKLSSDSIVTQTYRITIPESSFSVEYSGATTIAAGEAATLTIENTGGVDTTYVAEKLSITDNRGTGIYKGNAAGAVSAGERKNLAEIIIPAQAVQSGALLEVRVKDVKTDRIFSLSKLLSIAGLAATLQARTDKDAYLKTEGITGHSGISNGQTGLENGTLKVSVVGVAAAGSGNFEHFLPKERWWPFKNPTGAATGPDGAVYIVDTDEHCIRKFDGDGNFIASLGSKGGGDGQFYYPFGVAVSSGGYIYVADTYNYRIQKFDVNGNFVAKWGTWGAGNGQFDYPHGIAVAPDGSVYVADTWNNRIQKFDGNGKFIAKWGKWGNLGAGNGQFAHPHGIAVAPDGSVFVADTWNNRIQKFDRNGNFIMKWGSWGLDYSSGGGYFSNPYGIAVAPDGSVFVADTYNHRIQKFDGNGNFIIKWGSWGNWGCYDPSGGYFGYPLGIAVSSNGSVYVADTWNRRIQKFDGNGTYIVQWGFHGSDDGEFYYPYGIAAGLDGSLYIADTGNHRIQRFDSQGNFVSKWGSQGYGNGQFYLPKAVATAPDGTVYVADALHVGYGYAQIQQIQKFDKNGVFIKKWGSYGSGDGQFKAVGGITVDSDGFVYIADTYNNRVQKFDSNGIFVAKWGSYGSGNGQLYGPAGVAVAVDGSIYVADTGNHRIQKFDGSGNFITKWGALCSTDNNWDGIPDKACNGGLFNYPAGIAASPDGFIYVTDFSNNRIQKFDANGVFIEKWESETGVDGQFKYPWGIAVSPDGSVYVADTFNHRIQKMTPAGGGIKTYFETTVPVTQPADTTQDYTTAIGTLNTAGKLWLQAELKNSLGQKVADAEYPFYIIEGNTLLLYNADKKMYRPGETISITGEVKNLAAIEAAGLSLLMKRKAEAGSEETIQTSTFNVPAGGSHSFMFATIAGAEGVVSLRGSVTQSNTTLVEIADQYEVASPKVTATVSAPDVVGNEPFGINVELRNEGRIEATIRTQTTDDRGQTEVNDTIIPAGETRLIQYSRQIAGNTIYTFTFTGDLNQTLTKTVAYGLSVGIQFGIQSPEFMVPEGKTAVPVTISNTGTLDASLNVAYRLGQVQETRSYFVPKGGNSTDTLYYDLTEGIYQLSAESLQPSATATASLSVKKENKAEMAMTVGTQTNELIPVTVNLTNSGYNAIEGTVLLSAAGSQGLVVWSGEQAITQLAAGSSQLVMFNINPSAMAPGAYTVKAELFNNGGEQLKAQSSALNVQGASFELTRIPAYQTFNAGQEGSFSFKVRNAGNQEGAAELTFKAYDLIDSKRTEWLKPGEEKEISFNFLLPDDLEEKDYFADYTLTPALSQAGEGAIKGQVKYHLAGINLGVNASLDKQTYAAGDTARLTLQITDNRAQRTDVGLFARVNYNGYEEQKPFTLNGGQTLTFDVPLGQITGEKLFYGIYHEGGRSIHLNSVYLYKAGDALTITTDKQVYNPGDVVAVEIRSKEPGLSGQMTLTGPGGYYDIFEFYGAAARSITLPSITTAGTYTIAAELRASDSEQRTASHPIDVNGIQVKIVEASLDKAKYAATDTISANLTITSNADLSGTLKTWVVDPAGTYTPAGESAVTLSSGENTLLMLHASLSTEVSGIHRLVYGIYSGNMLLSSGSEAFDVGDAVLLGLATDKTDYPSNTETVKAFVDTYGTVGATLEFQIDGNTLKTESVALDGFTTLYIDLGTVSAGPHTLKAVLTAGSLISSKETNFIYGSSLPDLIVDVLGGARVGGDNFITITAAVINQGKTTSSPTTVALYDGEHLIDSKPVKVLDAGETDTVAFAWSALGKAGDHAIKAVVDPGNMVAEFNELNNTATATIQIPNVVISTLTDREAYKIRQKVYITSTITNLTAGNTYGNLALATKIKDPSGAITFISNAGIGLLAPSGSTTTNDVWNTTGLPLDGVYTITLALTSGSQLIAHNTKFVVLEKAPDFTMNAAATSLKTKQGEKAVYAADIASLNGWNKDVALSIDGLPTGASVTFSPDRLIPPGQVQVSVMTSGTTTTGTHTLYLTAQGEDEGEIITHTVPLTLEVSGFELEAATPSRTVMQLETAVFPIDLVSRNGYAGNVNMTIAGLPFGMRASFDNVQSDVPGSANLTVLTSKYAKPGTYTLTVTGDDGLVRHSLNVSLALQPNPAIALGIVATPGPGPQNDALVRVFGQDLQLLKEFTAFNTKYGASAVSADIDGDGYDELVVGQGPGPRNTATLRVFKRNGSLVTEYTAFDTKYGLVLASGDLDGDWKDELIVGMGPDPKNPGTIKVLKYNGSGFTEITIWTIYPDTTYGLNIATGDVDGDGTPELITAPGPGPYNPALVKTWKYETGALTELSSFTAFDGGYGVNIAAGDIDGDGIAEIITGAGPDPKNTATVRTYRADGTMVKEFMPYDGKHAYGVNVSAGDVNGDGIAEIITGPGPGPQNDSLVKLFKADGVEIGNFPAYPNGIRYGVTAGAGNVGSNTK